MPCDNCDDFMGYQYSDLIQHHYTTYHFPNGKLEMGSYSDSQKLIHAGKSAYCSNCNNKLGFLLIRNDYEELELAETEKYSRFFSTTKNNKI